MVVITGREGMHQKIHGAGHQRTHGAQKVHGAGPSEVYVGQGIGSLFLPPSLAAV